MLIKSNAYSRVNTVGFDKKVSDIIDDYIVHVSPVILIIHNLSRCISFRQISFKMIRILDGNMLNQV